MRSLLAIQLLQGVAYGVSQTALGTTLVNDTLLSRQRNKGDIIYGWAGRIGIPLGLFLGYGLSLGLPVPQAYFWALIPCALSFVLVAQTVVPIKAPVKVPLLTFDRFFCLVHCLWHCRCLQPLGLWDAWQALFQNPKVGC